MATLKENNELSLDLVELIELHLSLSGACTSYYIIHHWYQSYVHILL